MNAARNGAAKMSMQTVSPGLAKADMSTRFTEEQKKLILDTCCGGASQSEAGVLLAIAEARGLNPVLGECYFVKRYDSKAKRDVWAVQASIDSLRIKAEQTGLYEGQDEPEFEYNAEGLVVLARVKIYRKDWPRPAVGVARWDEYVQTTREGSPTRFWAQMPHNQLAKCAEALGLRKAFPAVLAKLYVPEEMEQADNEVPVRAPHQVTTTPAKELAAPLFDSAVFEDLCSRIDAADSKAALNKVAAATKKAKNEGLISEAHYSTIASAANTKAKLIEGDRPSRPRSPEVEDDPMPERMYESEEQS